MEANRAQIADTIHEGEYWSRCPFCGDSSRSPEKAHYSVKLSNGIYYCLRCNESGKLSIKELFQLIGQLPFTMTTHTEDDSDDKFDNLLESIEEGTPNTSRPSLLSRWHYDDIEHSRQWDVFKSFDIQDSAEIGLLLRNFVGDPKSAYFYGTRGFAWPQAESGRQLISTSANPIRIVEGPYDVLSNQDVCVFGLITKHNLSELIGHTIILTPDGDVWQKPSLLKLIKTTLRWLLYSNQAKPHLIGLEYLEDGTDPDDVPISERNFISRKDLYKAFPPWRPEWNLNH